MDFNATNPFLTVPDVPLPATLSVLLGQDKFQSPVSISLTAVVTTIVSFVAWLWYTPPVHPKSPEFTTDTLPILGSFGFLSRQWSWWKGSVARSKTGNFSFRQGKRHIVGITGAAARKVFFDHPALCLVSGAALLPFGVHFWPPNHEIFTPSTNRARNNTFFLRRMIEMMKTDKLERHLRAVVGDARVDFEALMDRYPNGVCNLPDLWKTILRQNMRLFYTEDIANNESLFKRVSGDVDVLLHTYSPFNAYFPWLKLEPGYIKRRLARWGLIRLTRELYYQRTAPNAPKKDDPLQTLINYGDPEPYINEFFVSASFITTTNAHVAASQMLEAMAVHPEWQAKVYDEIKVAAERYGKDRRAPLVEKLADIPLTAWETQFPAMDLCLKETIRVWTSFGVSRLNTSSEPIPIPGTDEVIPGKTFVVYCSTELNFNENLYPNAAKFDPLRFTEGREEFKKEPYGFFGWGNGVHPCAGMRWAKLQQYIMLANALALYELTSVTKEGLPDPFASERQRLDRDVDHDKPFALPPAYCKFVLREKV